MDGLSSDRPERRETRRRRRTGGAVPLLEAAFRLFGWDGDAAAADALGTTPAQVARWRSGEDQMTLADYLTLTSMIGVAAAGAMKGEGSGIADLSAAAEELGLSPRAQR